MSVREEVIESATDLRRQPALDSDVTRDRRFDGRVAVVAGGAGGIGSATAYRFLNDGACVAIVDLNEEKAERLLKDHFKQYGGRVKYYKADVSVRQNCFDVVEAIAADFGKINFLHNAVAYFKSAGLGSDDEDWSNGMRGNVASFAFMAQACYARLRDLPASEPRAIVNTSSVSSRQVQPNRWTYLAAKGAIDILTKAMALDMAPGRVRVNSVSPSYIWSPEVAKVCVGTRAEWEPKVPGPFHILNRMGEMAEVAAAVTFLCSRDASYINATDLNVDGGYGAMSAEGRGDKSKFAGTETE